MPKLFPPALLKDADTQKFCLQKQITDVDSLKRHLQSSVCLGVDIEGCEGIGQGVTSIGLAILPPTNLPLFEFRSKAFPRLPFKTQEVVGRCDIEAYCIYLGDRCRKKPHPPFSLGHNIRTTKENVSKEIQIVVNNIRQCLNKDIILVAWHPHPRELPGIQALCPNIFNEVIGWIDVTDVTRQICSSHEEDLTKTWPSLGDMLISAGLSENCQPQRSCHNAGIDAIHAVVLLIQLLTYPGDTPLVVRRRRPLKQWK